jgi:hypothetical protein
MAARVPPGRSLGAAAYWAPRIGVFQVKEYEDVYAEAALAARDRLLREALVASLCFSGALYYYTDFPVLRWDQIEPADFARYAAASRQAARPVCAVLFDVEAADAFRRCPGNWTRLAQVRNVGLWQLDASGP